jgi:hypothetical protein
MPLPIPKVKYEISVDTTKFRVTDITGEYSATNLTGWGAPNAILAQTALVFAVKRKDSEGDEWLAPEISQVVFDELATNDMEKAVDFVYTTDSIFEISLMLLPGSDDGVNYLAGGVIPDDDYFYWANSGNTIWKMTLGTPVAVTDPNTLVGLTGDVTQVTETDILLPKLAVKKQAMYKEYRLVRMNDCESPKYKDLRWSLVELSQDIQGAIYAFYSGLTVQAQDQVESMLEEYQLV